MFLTKTFAIEDCYYYSTTTYGSSSVNINVPLPSAPFSLEYLLTQTRRDWGVPYIDIGDSSNNRMLIGQYARAGTNGIIVYKGSQTNHPYGTDTLLNQDNTIYFAYDGTQYTYKLNNGTPMTVADAGVTFTKIIHSEGGDGGTIRNVKVKQL